MNGQRNGLNKDIKRDIRVKFSDDKPMGRPKVKWF
jgi:hypothetical protein